MQLNCLFWNSGNKLSDDEISALCATNAINLVALAEYPGDGDSLLRALSSRGLSFYLVPKIACDRITLFSAFSVSHVTHRQETDRYTVKELKVPGRIPLLLCIVHLPSKMHADDVDQLHSASYLRQDVESAENDAGHQNTVLFGDFNMNPFDDGMISAAALNSVSCLETSRREKRVVSGREHKFFYNPSWNLLGDFRGPPGTYFHKSPGYLSTYWNLLDQVILRPAIAGRFDWSRFVVPIATGVATLADAHGRPAVGDHFPLVFSLNLT